VQEGRVLATSGACTAAIDVSDGLSSDLGHLCTDSGIGAMLYEEQIPLSGDLIAAGSALGKDPLGWVMNGGEDYVLLATVKAESLDALVAQFQSLGLSLFPIGECIAGSEMFLKKRDNSLTNLTRGGWDHFW
jgi:thiamine-monophosphate kinase